MPDRREPPRIGPVALLGFAAALRTAEQDAAARRAALLTAFQPSQAMQTLRLFEHAAAIRGIEQAQRSAIQQLQAEQPYQRGLRELERLASERPAWLTGFDANSHAAQALTAGLQIDAATAARQAAIVEAVAAHARHFEVLSDSSRAALEALRFGQRPIGPRLWPDIAPEYEVEERPNSPLVVVTWGGRRQGAGAKRGDRIAETQALIERALLIRRSGTTLTRYALRSQVGRLNVVNIRSLKGLDNMIDRCRREMFTWLVFPWLRDAPLSELEAKLDSLGH